MASEGHGWAHLVALLIACALGWAAIEGHRWWYSPPPLDERDHDVTPGETLDDTDSDTTDDTDSDTADTVADTGWWGRRITLSDGSTIVRTGDDVDAPLNRDEFADHLLADGDGRYVDWVREIRETFGVSKATAKRDIGQAKARAKDRVG